MCIRDRANTFVPAGMADGQGGEFRQNDDAYTYPDADAVGYYDPSYDAYEDNLAEAIELLKEEMCIRDRRSRRL